MKHLKMTAGQAKKLQKAVTKLIEAERKGNYGLMKLARREIGELSLQILARKENRNWNYAQITHFTAQMIQSQKVLTA